MSAPPPQVAKFSLKVMINKQKTKVLFAEVGSDFADVLLSFLALPLGQIVRLLEKHYGVEAPLIGSLNNMYKSVSNLNSSYFGSEEGKQMLLNPRSSFQDQCRQLKLNLYDAAPIKYFTCQDWNCFKTRYRCINMYYDTAICACGNPMNREIELNGKGVVDANGGVFTLKTASFLICDDLGIVPNIAGSIIQTLTNLGITDLDGEQRIVTVGFSDIMDLLKGLLASRTPLTDIILKRKLQMGSAMLERESYNFVRHRQRRHIPNSKKITVKVMVQKSTSRFLFVQAEKNFVDFLFSLLTIPLGGVVDLLGANSFTLGNVGNFYSSVAKLNGSHYLKTPNTQTMLLKPKLPPWYIPYFQILPLSEELFYPHDFDDPVLRGNGSSPLIYKDPKGDGSYVRGPGMFMVTDDLTVKPLSMHSSIALLNRLKIPLSDVMEIDLNIGLQEASSILRASLTSTSALTDGLINPILMKQPKHGEN